MEKIKNMKTEKIKIPQIKIKCKCKICGFNSMTKKEVKRHLKSEHKIKRPYQYYKILSEII